MAIAGGNITLDSTEGMDKITQTEKVTTPYHSNGNTDLLAANIVSSSQTGQATNETYFFGIAHSSTPTVQEWNVAFGSVNGYGSLKETNTKAETEAVYRQFASVLLPPMEVTGGFHISRNNSLSTAPTQAAVKTAGARDDEIFVLSARRTNMKDRLNKGTWQISLSGSLSNGTAGADILHLKDDSVNGAPTATPAGDRYNIVSCSAAGVIAAEASARTFGFFYPDQGLLVFSQQELSASMPGSAASGSQVVVFDDKDHKGFHIPATTNSNTKQGLRFINALQPTGAKLSFRDEEDQVSAQYFCRVRSGQMNFSNNPTFVSGSLNELRKKDMKGSPTTFITSVQLYNTNGDMVAVGNLSTPLKKSFTSEATIKVKLTY